MGHTFRGQFVTIYVKTKYKHFWPSITPNNTVIYCLPYIFIILNSKLKSFWKRDSKNHHQYSNQIGQMWNTKLSTVLYFHSRSYKFCHAKHDNLLTHSDWFKFKTRYVQGFPQNIRCKNSTFEYILFSLKYIYTWCVYICIRHISHFI